VLLALIALPGATGCGGGTATVSGKVYYKNTPLKGGNVTFTRTDGKPSVAGRIGEDGSYTLEKVPAGDVTITVETESLNPRLRTGIAKVSAPPPGHEPPGGYNPGGQGGSDFKNYVRIPEKYADPGQSGLHYTVAGGTQVYDIKLD